MCTHLCNNFHSFIYIRPINSTLQENISVETNHFPMASPPSNSMLEEFSNKELLDSVRPLLQRDKIRLWEPPYTDANTGAENIPDV